MNPPVIIGNATLYLGDCLEILPTLSKVDAVITDPPYGVLAESWDAMTFRQLARFTMAWVSQVADKSETLLTFFAQEKRAALDPLLHVLYDDSRQLVWNKCGGRVSEDGMFYSFEPIFFCRPKVTWSVAEPKTIEVAGFITKAREAAGLSKGAVDMLVRGKKTGLCYRWEEAACLPTLEQVRKLREFLALPAAFDTAYEVASVARNETITAARAVASENAAKICDVFSVPPTGGADRHPTEKPLQLMVSLVEIASERGCIVLDPFMGSGTTGVAAIQLGRSFIGIEREPKYFDIACRRIEQAQAQGKLFEPERAVPTQMVIE
jgi:DNA modification methylase